MPVISIPVAEKISNEIFSLPMYPGLTEEQIKETVHKIEDFVS
jgi:dTDP-4-amino-4,6-dideoxygalactose transaminase